MKKLILLSVFVLTFASLSFSQSIPEPDFSWRPYILLENNTFKNFERVEAKIDVKSKGMGYGGAEMYYTAFNSKSNLRFKSNEMPRVFIKFDSNIDPVEMISLSIGEVKKDRRRFLNTSMAIGGKAQDTNSSFVAIEFKKIRDGIFEIILPSNMLPGEYAFMPTGNLQLSCFGID